MTDSPVQQLSLAQIKAALARSEPLSPGRRRLREECRRRIARCNHILNLTGLFILGYTALTVWLCC